MNSGDMDHLRVPFSLPVEASLKTKISTSKAGKQHGSKRARERYEGKMHKGPCSAVPFFMYVTKSGSRATQLLGWLVLNKDSVSKALGMQPREGPGLVPKFRPLSYCNELATPTQTVFSFNSVHHTVICSFICYIQSSPF
jgi:hypothetical protein